MNNQFPHARGTPLNPHDTDRDRGPRTVRRQRLLAVIAAAVLGVVVIMVGAFALGMLPLFGDAAVEPALVADRIAFVSDRDGDEEIYVMNADGSGVEQLTFNDSDDRYPAWSPDGSRIVFASERENDADMYDIYVMNADGSGVEQLTDDCSNYAPAWSPDGDRIAFTSRGNIYVMNADGSGVELLMGTSRDSCAQVFVSDRDGEAAWYIRNADGSVEPYELDGDSWYRSSVYAGPEWSPDGSRIALRTRLEAEFGVYVMNADGSGLEELSPNDVTLVGRVGWSPDGDRVVFGATFGYGDDGEIYVVNVDGSSVVPLTDNEQEDYWPAWSPDGSRIAFVSERDGDTGIYVMNADGIDVMNDGIYVKYDYIFGENADGSGVERLDGSGAVRLSEGGYPAWSPLLD